MAHEVERRRIIDAAGHGHAGLHAFLLGAVQGGLDGVAVRVHAHIVVAGLDARGEGGAACAGVRHQTVRGIGAGEPRVDEVVQVEVTSVEHPAAADLLQAHAVADHHDDVLDPLGAGLRHGHRLIRLRHRVLVIFAELVVGVFGHGAGDVFLREGAGCEAERQEDQCYSLHNHRLIISKWMSVPAALQVTVFVWPGRSGKKLSLQKAGATSSPSASSAFRMFI